MGRVGTSNLLASTATEKRLYSSMGTIKAPPKRRLVGMNSLLSSLLKLILLPMLEMFMPKPNWHSRCPIVT